MRGGLRFGWILLVAKACILLVGEIHEGSHGHIDLTVTDKLAQADHPIGRIYIISDARYGPASVIYVNGNTLAIADPLDGLRPYAGIPIGCGNGLDFDG